MPAINNSGTVLFHEISVLINDNPQTPDELLQIKNGVITTLVDPSSGLQVSGSPSLNDLGAFAFPATYNGVAGIYRERIRMPTR